MTEGAMDRRAYRIRGRVQGVGFRWWARETAAGLGLRGTVRNDRDGAVRLEALGEAERLELLELRLRDGPPGARVREVLREEPGGEDLPPDFRILA
jgi:acylphosphatase